MATGTAMAAEVTINTIHAQAAAIVDGDTKAGWDVWDMLEFYLLSYHADEIDLHTKTVQRVLECLMSKAKIGIGYGPHGRSLLMQAIHCENKDCSNFLMDLFEHDPKQFPLDVDLQNDGASSAANTTIFTFACRWKPAFAMRLAPYVSSRTFLRRPLLGWPLIICILDDLFIKAPRPNLRDQQIELVHHLLQPNYDFRVPVCGLASQMETGRTPQELLQYYVNDNTKTYLDANTWDKFVKLGAALDAAVQRVRIYSENFEPTVKNAFGYFLPNVLISLVLQFAAMTEFV